VTDAPSAPATEGRVGSPMGEVVVLGDEPMDVVRDRVAALVAAGELVVVPAETMYAVVGDPFHGLASDRLYAARRAGRDRPLHVVVHNPRQLPAFADVGEPAQRLMAAHWPGPLTLLLRAGASMTWDLGEAEGTVAVRMPAEPLLLKVLAVTGPLACTAASVAGAAPPGTVGEARASRGDAVALYVDAGPRTPAPSTVVDASRGGAEVRRLGAVSADAVFAAASGT
jgi:L-threonylcarbamoyladenylate synthase